LAENNCLYQLNKIDKIQLVKYLDYEMDYVKALGLVLVLDLL
jgi:hypothetical protein